MKLYFFEWTPVWTGSFEPRQVRRRAVVLKTDPRTRKTDPPLRIVGMSNRKLIEPRKSLFFRHGIGTLNPMGGVWILRGHDTWKIHPFSIGDTSESSFMVGIPASHSSRFLWIFCPGSLTGQRFYWWVLRVSPFLKEGLTSSSKRKPPSVLGGSSQIDAKAPHGRG